MYEILGADPCLTDPDSVLNDFPLVFTRQHKLFTVITITKLACRRTRRCNRFARDRAFFSAFICGALTAAEAQDVEPHSQLPPHRVEYNQPSRRSPLWRPA